MIDNPWIDLKNQKMKRVNSKNKFDIYWAKDVQGKYSLLFKVKNEFLKFTNIETKEFETKNSEDYLVIILKESSNWEIFKIFCDDIILNVESDSQDDRISQKLYNRIIEWRDLLQGKIKKILSLEEQLGLFGELLTLKNIILDNNGTVESWCGPEKHLQDFACRNCAIEIKSGLSSQNKIITISSKNQLKIEREYLFLIFYSLTKQEFGISIDQLVSSIGKVLISDKDRTDFFKKLLEVGYNFEEKNYLSFSIDSENYYEVTDKFPKLDSKILDSRILEVKYKIDLNKCEEFKIKKDKILGEL